MTKKLEVEKMMSSSKEGVILSKYGNEATKKILNNYSGGQIKEISGVSRSALSNYVAGTNRISKRGQDALKKMTLRYNNDFLGADDKEPGKSLINIRSFTDRELLEELKNRGFNVFVSV